MENQQFFAGNFLFSKGGFVSVPPCAAAAILKIPYFTHECDFTPGLATRINSKKASKILGGGISVSFVIAVSRNSR